jgi:antitoxin (DNA-binding transcriptional repressor) of toxin-antitoxin stability system
MKELNVREMRANIGRLDKLADEASELIIIRRGQPIARVFPISSRRTARITRICGSSP